MSASRSVPCPQCKMEGGTWKGNHWFGCLTCRGEGLVDGKEGREPKTAKKAKPAIGPDAP